MAGRIRPQAVAQSALSDALKLTTSGSNRLALMHTVEVQFERGRWLAGVAEGDVKRSRDAALREVPHRPGERVAAAGLDAIRVRLRTASDAESGMLIALEEPAHSSDLVMTGLRIQRPPDESPPGSTTRMVIGKGTADMPLPRR